jgi:adenylate cyclase
MRFGGQRMTEKTKPHPITIDLNEFKLHIELKSRIELTLHFNSPSRKFYLSVIAFVVSEMKRQGKIISILLEGHQDLLALLNETIGGAAGSSETENLLPRIYRKWKDALPNLEEAPLFKVLGRRKEYYDEGIGKTYPFTEAEKNSWANLFEYRGSYENVRLKFAVDRIGAGLDDVEIIYEDCSDGDAWDRFISDLKEKKLETDQPVSEEPEVPIPRLEKRGILSQGRYHWVALVAAIVVVLGAITLAIWEAYLRPASGDIASIEKMAFPLPNEPSIAVLPFTNMSDDPKQEFLCDGMTEGIITALSRVPRLFVISRTSTSTYKGKPVKVKQVSEELGVRYVVEGSIQRSGDRVRITAQMIDALTGNHLWVKRYDRDLKDIFALQDEITVNILTNVQVKLMWGGDALRAEKFVAKHYSGKQGFECYLKHIEARQYGDRWNIEDNNRARRIIEETMAMCPENPMGYLLLGFVYYHDYFLDYTNPPQETLKKCMELAQKALAIDDSMPDVHSFLGLLHSRQGEHDKAIVEGEKAMALNPGGAYILGNYAASLTIAGRSEQAIPLFQKAIRLNPFGPSGLYRDFGNALRNTGRYEEAVSAFKKAIQIAPDDLTAHLQLAATYGYMGREREARLEAAEVLRINPKFSLDEIVKRYISRDQSSRDRLVSALRKAGLK